MMMTISTSDIREVWCWWKYSIFFHSNHNDDEEISNKKQQWWWQLWDKISKLVDVKPFWGTKPFQLKTFITPEQLMQIWLRYQGVEIKTILTLRVSAQFSDWTFSWAEIERKRTYIRHTYIQWPLSYSCLVTQPVKTPSGRVEQCGNPSFSPTFQPHTFTQLAKLPCLPSTSLPVKLIVLDWEWQYSTCVRKHWC